MAESMAETRTPTAARGKRAQRALERQLAYQQAKARQAASQPEQYIASMRQQSQHVRAILERVRPVAANARVLEVGSGAHGLVFYFPASRAIGVDPLAAEYAALFPTWQRRIPTIAAAGEALPFASRTFDVVLCDNVVDHAEQPAGIVREIARVLAPGGLLYFTVNCHHAIYGMASWLHAAWNAAGVRFEIGPFADHTVHLTLRGARRLFRGVPLRIIAESNDIRSARQRTRLSRPRHAGDRLKKVFFKNARYEVVAEREP
jgi:SAM-dependent methyltransferase